MNPLVKNRDRILDLVNALGEKSESAFDRSIGKDERCLSPRRIVQVIQLGASADDLNHLKTCMFCRATLSRLEGKRLGPDPEFVSHAMKEAEEKDSRVPGRRPRKEPQMLAVVLGSESPFVEVGEKPGKDLRLVLDLFPVFRAALLRRIVQDSLKVQGAFSASTGKIDESIDLDEDSTPDFLRISFASGQLAPRVLEAIRNHQRVIDTVEVRGRFKDSSQVLVGRASIEFRG